MMVPQASILVVDDDPAVRKYLEIVLTHDGYQVWPAESGEAALEHTSTQEFDLALVDVRMPGIGGMELTAMLRQRWPDMTIIVLTAYASLETAVEALRQGAHDYLFKPCRRAALRESVRMGLLKRQQRLRQRDLLAQLKRSLNNGLETTLAATVEPAATPPFTTGPERFLQRADLIVDFMRHVVTLDGYLLELSPTEFDLLAYLASEAPRVVSAQELAQEVQGYDVEPQEARETVRYHIYRIRRKVQTATGHTDLIRTVRGIGYALE